MDGFQWNQIISRFPHLAEGIFEGLDDQSPTSCRLVEYIAEFIMKSSIENNIDLNAKNSSDVTGFHYACLRGQVKIVELLITNSVEFNIDLNALNAFPAVQRRLFLLRA